MERSTEICLSQWTALKKRAPMNGPLFHMERWECKVYRSAASGKKCFDCKCEQRRQSVRRQQSADQLSDDIDTKGGTLILIKFTDNLFIDDTTIYRTANPSAQKNFKPFQHSNFTFSRQTLDGTACFKRTLIQRERKYKIIKQKTDL